MRTPRFTTTLLLGLGLLGAACGPGVGSDTDGGGDSCSGSEARCLGNLYQTCVGGTFQTDSTCTGSCSVALGGCVDCNPAGGNTCNGNSVYTCNADGTYGSLVQDCGADMQCAGGACTNACTADGVDLIYVVDDQYNFLSFDPRKLPADPFTQIGSGPLNCPAGAALPSWTSPATPFSMSVDREGKAWVLYTSGQIFNVDIHTGACTATNFAVGQGGTWYLFGMGFSTDAAGGDTEKLFIGGGAEQPTVTGEKFGYIDTATSLNVTTVGNLTNPGENSPEFTGTGDAASFAYFPGNISNGFVQQIDKATGNLTGTAMQAGPVVGGPSAWAFAHWGGKFYIFVTDSLGNSQVQVVNRQTGAYEGVVLQNLPYQIVGAGVSTCAPVEVQ